MARTNIPSLRRTQLAGGRAKVGVAMTKEAEAAAASAPPPEPERKPWHRRLNLAISAFIMSVTITLINAFYSVRGSEVIVLEPEQVILYRDGEGEYAVLGLAIGLPMINAGGGHQGDVLLKADIQPGNAAPRFRYMAVVTPVFTDVPNAAERCALGQRCVPLPGLLIMETPNEVVDIPGGSARSRAFSFVASTGTCARPHARCAAYGNFDQAIRQLGTAPIQFTVRLEFYGDGDRTIECRTDAADLRYLREIGWVGLACRAASVRGAPLL